MEFIGRRMGTIEEGLSFSNNQKDWTLWILLFFEWTLYHLPLKTYLKLYNVILASENYYYQTYILYLF